MWSDPVCIHSPCNWKFILGLNRCNRINEYIFTLSPHNLFSAAGKKCFGSIVVLFAFIIIWCYFAFMPHYTISFLSLSLALSLRVALIGLNSIDVLAQAEKDGSCFKNRSDLTDQWSSPTTKAFSHKHRWHRSHVSPLRIHQAFINS